MENTCQYCHQPFAAKRITRKYCGNSCRQLDYFKRKRDFSLEGVLTEDGLSVTGNTVPGKEISGEQPFGVKEEIRVIAQSEKINLSEQELHVLAEKLFELLEDRIEKIIYRKTFYANGSVSVKDSVKQDQIYVKDPALAVNKTGATVKDAVKEHDDSVKEVSNLSETTEEKKFKPVQSHFIQRIVDHLDRNNSDALSKFLYPHHYWRGSYLQSVKWVSLRLRCLVESILNLSQFRYIDTEDLKGAAEGLQKLEASGHYQKLRTDYPHKDLVKTLSTQIGSMADACAEEEVIKFFISPERKAELIATRYEIGNFVPKINFTELDFSE